MLIKHFFKYGFLEFLNSLIAVSVVTWMEYVEKMVVGRVIRLSDEEPSFPRMFREL